MTTETKYIIYKAVNIFLAGAAFGVWQESYWAGIALLSVLFVLGEPK